MSNLSNFFPTASGAGETNTSGFRVFMETGSVTIPAGVCYVAYTVMGAGNCSCNNACGAGGGGGFSHYDGVLSCASAFDVCAVVGISCTSCGCTTCVSGFSTGTICATGAVNSSPGCGVGGLINTCGGASGGNFGGGGGAGGIFSNGGEGGYGSSATIIGGGGGMGSGGGGGGGWQGRGGCGGGGGSPGARSDNCWSGGAGGSGTRGRGGASGNMQNCYCGQSRGNANGESGYHIAYTDSGKYSQAKTFFAAAGGGGSSAYGYNSAVISPAGNGGSGGGAGASWCNGTSGGSGGFGGGASRSNNCQSQPGCGGGGGGFGGCGGHGVAAVEWWLGS